MIDRVAILEFYLIYINFFQRSQVHVVERVAAGARISAPTGVREINSSWVHTVQACRLMRYRFRRRHATHSLCI